MQHDFNWYDIEALWRDVQGQCRKCWQHSPGFGTCGIVIEKASRNCEHPAVKVCNGLSVCSFI